MFQLVSGRHVGAHLGGHQHGVSIQISDHVYFVHPSTDISVNILTDTRPIC